MPSAIANFWNKVKNNAANWAPPAVQNLLSVENAPPAVRNIMIAYAPLVRIEEGKNGKKRKIPVGSYVPEAKILADAGQLKAQIEAKKWAGNKKISYQKLLKERPQLAKALYWPNGELKTPFQLSIVPSFNKGPVQKFMEREYKYRRDNQLPLPSLVSKYRVGPDFLRDIGEAGLALKEYPTGFQINIKNPVHTMTKREKFFHYTGIWASLLLTITGAVTIGITNPWLFIAGASALYLAQKSGNDFGLYDVAESLHRDFGAFTSALGWGKNISFAKTVETGIYLAALGFVGFLAVSVAWAGALTLPCWSWLAANGVGLGVVQALQYASAGFFAVVAGAMSYAAVTFPVRYFWGLSIYDNQEHPTQEEVDALPTINVNKNLPSAIERECQNVLDKIAKPKYGILPEDQVKLSKTIRTQFTTLKVQAAKAEKAANDHQEDHGRRAKHRNNKKVS